MRDRILEAVVALGIAGLVALLSASGSLAPLQRPVADSALALAAGRPPALPAGLPDVSVVALDPQSLRALDTWPWPRNVYARALRRLDAAGAAAIAFDVDFSTARDPTADAEFAAAIAESGRVVLASFRQFQQLEGIGELEVANLPLPALAEGAAAVGSVMVPVEPDGVVRASPRAIEIAGSSTVPLAAAAFGVATGRAVEGRAGETFRIDYRRRNPPFPVLSMADLLEGRFPIDAVAGRVVLIGATAAELQDLWPTPLEPAWPGVLIQAVAYRTLAAEHGSQPVLRGAGPWPQALLLLALALAAGGATHRRRVLRALGLGIGVLLLAAGCLHHLGLLIDPVAPLGVLAAHYVLGLEVVRRRFGRQVEQRELSLAAVFRVGTASQGASSDDGLSLGISLLGEVVGAAGVALYRATPEGELDGHCISWRAEGEDEVGDLELARSVLREGQARLVQGSIPGGDRRGSAVYAPLEAGGSPVGVLVVERNGREALDDVQLRTIATVGAQLALAAANLRLVEQLQSSFETSVEAIASAIEARDGYTEMHCRRLAAFSARLGDRVGLEEDEIEAIRFGALLHDVGKIGIRDDILLKPGRFTPEERRSMEQHTEIGHRIVQPIRGLTETTLACVRHHHERWDGTGYPDGLAGEAIPLGARIVSIVDVWDALSTARPYKPAFPQERVLSILTKGRGTEFDPALVDHFLQLLEEEGEEMLALVASSSGDEG